MEYNYYEAVKADVLDYINNEVELADYESIEALDEYLNEELWVVDSVTGNASGSYTFNAYKAEEYLTHNWDLLTDALREFGSDAAEALERGAEYCDVTIRCYLLGSVISDVLEEITEEWETAYYGEE